MTIYNMGKKQVYISKVFDKIRFMKALRIIFPYMKLSEVLDVVNKITLSPSDAPLYTDTVYKNESKDTVSYRRMVYADEAKNDVRIIGDSALCYIKDIEEEVAWEEAEEIEREKHRKEMYKLARKWYENLDQNTKNMVDILLEGCVPRA